jgi:glutathione S-transferase
MKRAIKLYSFFNGDRSGKVRWTALELGYEIEEERISFPDNRLEPYRRINPYAQIPAAELDGQVMIESTALCLILAERHPEAGLLPAGVDERAIFWQSLSVSTNTLEQMTVNIALVQAGILEPVWSDLIEEPIRQRLSTFAGLLPEEGFILEDFSLADICAAYPLRTAVMAGLLPMEGRLKAYLQRLMKRPAARASGFFEGMDPPG